MPEIAKNKQLLADYSTLNEELKVQEEQTATPATGPNEILAKSAELSKAIPEFNNKLEYLVTQLSTPSNLIQRSTIDPSQIRNRIKVLEEWAESNKRRALDEQKMAKLAPELELITTTLQSTMNEMETAPPASLDQQELTLRKLEADKQRIHTLLESIPEGAEDLREKSKWQLSQLTEFIKRLGDTVGEKISALTSFLATKSEIQSQLADVNRQLEEDMQQIEDMPLSASTHHLATLKEQASKIEKLQQKLHDEVAPDSLDKDKHNEFDQLRKALEMMSEKIARAYEKAVQQVELQKAAELLKNNVNRANSDLVSLIDQAHRLLSDAAAIPQSYEVLANQIKSAVEEAQLLASEDPTADTLQANILEANAAQAKLDGRWQTWLKFVNERNIANAQLDTARSALQRTENKAVRSLDEAQADLADLIVREFWFKTCTTSY
jgi:DNA repair exonuclease SbcCD ATPase subunit